MTWYPRMNTILFETPNDLYLFWTRKAILANDALQNNAKLQEWDIAVGHHIIKLLNQIFTTNTWKHLCMSLILFVFWNKTVKIALILWKLGKVVSQFDNLTMISCCICVTKWFIPILDQKGNTGKQCITMPDPTRTMQNCSNGILLLVIISTNCLTKLLQHLTIFMYA